jgi:hypothetical protein
MDDAPSSDVNCIDNPCNRDEMAEYDIAQWKCKLDPFDGNDVLIDVCDGFDIILGALPGGRASIGKVGTVHEITVEWIHDRQGNTSSIILRTQTEDN